MTQNLTLFYKKGEIMKQCVKIHVVGKVQDVGFRKFTQKQAQIFQIEGYVQNLENGALTIWACGLTENLDQFIAQTYKGPTASSVQDVTVEPCANSKDFRGVFRIIE
jgi:acylphosphatase